MPNNKIPGGYILQPRKIDESGVMKEPPLVRELWLYLLRKVNWKEGKLSRGTGFFRFADIQDDLCWYVGFRKMIYSKPRLTKALRRLCEGNMTATMKATRGIIITILNYDYYQDPKNYEGNNEDPVKKQRSESGGHTIIKEGEKVKESKEKDLKPIVGKPEIPFKEIIEYLNLKAGKRYQHTTPKTQNFIKARWNEGFKSLDDYKHVIDVKCHKWLNTEDEKFLRPETLFGTKFEGYLNERIIINSQSPQVPKAATVYQADMLQKEVANQAYLKRRREKENADGIDEKEAIDITDSPRAIN